jgi:ELWxxDGT repeat protein
MNVGGTLFFRATAPDSGTELWKSDGTTAGTVLVKDINPGTASATPLLLSGLNGLLFFSATEPGTGHELYRSDGTVAGTILVKDINPGTANGLFALGIVVDPPDLSTAVVAGSLYFKAEDGAHGYELWKTDGTTAGTALVRDIYPGPTGSMGNSSSPFLSSLLDVNGLLFFRADDGIRGIELWKTDGSEAGTAMVQDINPGAANGHSDFDYPMVNVNGTLFFAATDPLSGTELWRLRPNPVRVASAVVNNGAAQRSMVTGLIVTFSEVVTLAASAFSLRRADGTAVGLTVTSALVNGRTVASLAFTGPDIIAGSLADGQYTLTIASSLVKGTDGQKLDGDGNGAPGGDATLALHRLYGDTNGDRRVDNADIFLFRPAFGRGSADPLYLAYLDYNGDGQVDGADYFQFRTRFGSSV